MTATFQKTKLEPATSTTEVTPAPPRVEAQPGANVVTVPPVVACSACRWWFMRDARDPQGICRGVGPGLGGFPLTRPVDFCKFFEPR